MSRERKIFVLLIALALLSAGVWGFALLLPARQPRDLSRHVRMIVTPLRNNLPPEEQVKLLTADLRKCEQEILEMRVDRILPFEKRRDNLAELQQWHASLLTALDYAKGRLKAKEAASGGT